ncbi:MAG: DUF1549 domain-containing protein [Chitinophagaceae bacterium]|nr:DUF1549 domain-containing protein [Chitinophagaceae bacterium]
MEETFWLWKFLGRLHPMVVHFPLGLILFAAILELFTFKKFNSALRPGIKVCLIVGVIAAVFSAAFGWLLAYGEEYAGNTLDLHQWLGIGTAAIGGVVLLAMLRLRKKQSSSGIVVYRLLLFFTAAGITLTGHFGASLTHGDEYLTEVLPAEDFGGGNINFASMNNDTAKLSKDQEKELNTRVKAIFAHNCYKCHGAQKVKGELRLDRKDMALKGGESGEVIVAGKPHESELIRRVMLPRDDEEAMPPKGKMLSRNDIDLLNFWILKGAPWPEDAESEKLFRVAKLEPRNPVLPAATGNHSGNPVDLWVNEYFKKNNIKWQPAVDDRIFLRRVYLDIIGLLPTPQALDSFLNDPDANKRGAWVRKLLNRNDDYAINWLTFWNDALRNDYTGTGYITGGRSDITHWLYNALRDNKPYNQFVKELISPTKESKGFIEGIRWRGVVNASQSTEIQAAQNVAQVFLGLNLKCASCHNSFINNWKLDDAYAFANIFSDSSLEINRCDKPTGKYTRPRMLWEQLGTIDSSATNEKKQQQLADIMTSPQNGRLARTMVNRIWAQMMGRGIVEPVDVMDNAPWSQDLLDWLSFDFASKNYDLKELIYLVATSQAYQQPSVGFKDPNKLMAQDYVFTGMVRRRMSGEKFADAVSNLVWPVFGDSMVMYKPVINADTTLVRRGSLVVNNSFLTALGRPNRETVSTGRESQANLLQALELTNGTRFNAAMKKGAERWKNSYNNTGAMITAIYRNALNRAPTDGELKVAATALGNNPSVDNVADLLWSIMLLPEFQLIY